MLRKFIKNFLRKKLRNDEIWGFDRSYYNQNNPDVAIKGIDPYHHYVEYGWKEGRDPSEYFSTVGYLAANPDVAAKQINPLQHFHKYGIVEGRAGWQKKKAEDLDALAAAEFKKIHVQLKELCRLIASLRNINSSLVVSNPKSRTLFVDISELVLHDRQTGIQRVVKSILSELLRHSPRGMRVVPIYGQTDDHGSVYRSARTFTQRFAGNSDVDLVDEFIQPVNGDVFLGLDLAPTLVPKMVQEGVYSAWRDRGVSIYFVVYDVLPITRPEFFAYGTEEQFSTWVSSVAQCADGAVCISRTVAQEFRDCIASFPRSAAHKMTIDWFHLASARMADLPSSEDRSGVSTQRLQISGKSYVLMVGTIEPRKGHKQIIDAFDTLWRKGSNTCLIIIGRKGWLADDLISTIVHHPLLDKRLFWCSDVDDIDLEYYYSNSAGLIAASYAEGYGLPLIEAAIRNIPVLARDIPVFHEVAGRHATYFHISGDFLVHDIEKWLNALVANTAIQSGGMPVQNWAQCAAQLISAVLGKESNCSQYIANTHPAIKSSDADPAAAELN